MRREHEIVRAFLVEARTDLHAAEVLAQQDDHAPAVAHCQQAIEKAIKAVLALQGVYPATHEVSEAYRRAFASMPDSDRIADLASRMEDIGVRSRYPLFRRADLPIWVPSERLGPGESERALDEASFVFAVLSQYLAEHGVGLPSVAVEGSGASTVENEDQSDAGGEAA